MGNNTKLTLQRTCFPLERDAGKRFLFLFINWEYLKTNFENIAMADLNYLAFIRLPGNSYREYIKSL